MRCEVLEVVIRGVEIAVHRGLTIASNGRPSGVDRWHGRMRELT